MIGGFVPELGQAPPERTDTNEHFFDRYSVAHFSTGALFALGSFGPAFAIGSHIAFEAVEDQLKKSSRSFWPDSRGDSWQNHLGDVATFTAGYFASRALLRNPGGSQIVALLALLGAGVWTYNVARGHSWVNPPG